MNFDHEKLDVYKAAIDFVILINSVVENLPRGRAYIADQLQRASASVPLNIAEGSGEFSANEKIRFYSKDSKKKPANHEECVEQISPY